MEDCPHPKQSADAGVADQRDIVDWVDNSLPPIAEHEEYRDDQDAAPNNCADHTTHAYLLHLSAGERDIGILSGL